MQTASIFEERDRWSGAIVLSTGLHVLLFGGALIGGYLTSPRGTSWGGPESGSAMQANIVNTVPLPRQQEPTQNILANDSKGLTQSVPQEAQPEPNAIPIPDKNVKTKQQKTAVTRAPDIKRPVTPPNDNVVPYGQGGPINVSYGAFSVGRVQGGFSFEGDFGTRFAYYVDQIKRKISNEWHPSEIGPGAAGHRAFLAFDINKDGSHGDVHVVQWSGIPALDTSAQRAIMRIDTFGALPQGYSGSYLHVELWFEPPK